MEESEKEAFYRGLYTFDKDDDDFEDVVAEESRRLLQSARLKRKAATDADVNAQSRKKQKSKGPSSRPASEKPAVAPAEEPIVGADVFKATDSRRVSKIEVKATPHVVVKNTPVRLDGRRIQQSNNVPLKRIINRTVSAPEPLAEDREAIVPVTPLLRSATTIAEPAPASKEAITKPAPRGRGRPKKDTVKLAPEHLRIFKSLVFYFIPNNDTAKPRRMRIAKAIEYGATWAKEWHEGVTHIIADNHIEYGHLLAWLKIQSLPPNVQLVKENYPAECLRFNFLLDPKERQFRVKDAPFEVVAVVERTPSEAPLFQKSLPLKPPTKGQTARQPKTPSRADESSLEQRVSLRRSPAHENRQQDALELEAKVDPNPSYGDALEAMILQTKATEGLPVDHDDDVDGAQASADEADSSEDEVLQTSSGSGSNHGKRPSWQETFQCMHEHDTTKRGENPNARTIDVLEKMARHYDQVQDHWRTTSYRKAIAQLRKEHRKIITKEQAVLLPFVGERLAAKIEEIVTTNTLRRLESAESDPTDKILQRFLNIYGVGIAQASKWITQGLKTLQDLQERASLTYNQRIGLDHYDDFLTRIPRTEVEKHGDIVRRAIFRIDPAFQITIGGSYRRGSKDSGDIDLIITKPDAGIEEIRAVIIDKLVPALFEQDFLKATLAATSRVDGTKWHGASCLPGSTVWRRIDFLFVPWNQMGAALIYFTGNDIFNRSIRLLASKKIMRLNQRGLYRDVLRRKQRAKITQGTLVESRDEKKIFEILGVPWRPPEHRNC